MRDMASSGLRVWPRLGRGWTGQATCRPNSIVTAYLQQTRCVISVNERQKRPCRPGVEVTLGIETEARARERRTTSMGVQRPRSLAAVRPGPGLQAVPTQ